MGAIYQRTGEVRNVAPDGSSLFMECAATLWIDPAHLQDCGYAASGAAICTRFRPERFAA